MRNGVWETIIFSRRLDTQPRSRDPVAQWRAGKTAGVNCPPDSTSEQLCHTGQGGGSLEVGVGAPLPYGRGSVGRGSVRPRPRRLTEQFPTETSPLRHWTPFRRPKPLY